MNQRGAVVLMLLRLYVLFLYVVYNINVSPAFRRDIYFAAVRSKFGMTTLNYWIILKIPSGSVLLTYPLHQMIIFALKTE